MASESINRRLFSGATYYRQLSRTDPGTTVFEAASASVQVVSRTWVRNGRKSRPMSPYSCSRTTIVCHNGIQRTYSGIGGYWVARRDGYMGGDPSMLGGFDSSVAAKAASKCLLNLQPAGPNLPVALGEAQKTIDMLGGRFKGILSLATKAAGTWRKNRFDRLPDGSKRLDDIWLELQYGWRPLFTDVYAGMEHLARNVRSPITVCTGSARDRVEFANRQTPSSPNHHASGFNDSRSRYVVKATLASPNLSNAHALGLTNPLVVAWELIPFSFVADWFLPVGDALASLDATSGYSFHSGCRTDVWHYESDEHFYVNLKNGPDFDFRETRARRVDMAMTRYVLTGFPNPTLPSFKNPLSVQHAANAVALAAQFFGAFRR